jgi:putative lipoprotein
VDASLTFNPDGTLSGNGGCNGLGGDYKVKGDQITFGPIMSTLMACDEPRMSQEDAVHQVLMDTVSYEIDGNTLTITNKDMVLVFELVAAE